MALFAVPGLNFGDQKRKLIASLCNSFKKLGNKQFKNVGLVFWTVFNPSIPCLIVKIGVSLLYERLIT